MSKNRETLYLAEVKYLTPIHGYNKKQALLTLRSLSPRGAKIKIGEKICMLPSFTTPSVNDARKK